MFRIDRNLLPLPSVEVKHAPFSLESLIAWLETKDASERYLFCDTEGCLLGQYTYESGGVYQAGKYRIGNACIASTPERRSATPLHRIAYLHSGPDTFGAALTRARAYLAEKKR